MQSSIPWQSWYTTCVLKGVVSSSEQLGARLAAASAPVSWFSLHLELFSSMFPLWPRKRNVSVGEEGCSRVTILRDTGILLVPTCVMGYLMQ